MIKIISRKQNNPGFTLIEILLVLAAIGLVISLSAIAYNQARSKSRDNKRVSDIAVIQLALETYHRQEGRYPDTLTAGQPLTGPSGITYLASVPTAPNVLDGNCATTTYQYQITDSQQDYGLDFCLGGNLDKIAAGNNCAGANGIEPGLCCENVWRPILDGRTYETTKIGEQCWIRENLDTGTMVSGAGTEPQCHETYPNYWSCQNDPSITEKYCYDDNASNCTDYGALYEWAEALGLPYDCANAASVDNGDGTYTLSCPLSGDQTIAAKQQGICPYGWHIPTYEDMETLGQEADNNHSCVLGGCSTAGGRLKAKADDLPIPWNGTNDFSYTIIPAGDRDTSGDFHVKDEDAYIWITMPRYNSAVSAQFIYLIPSNTDLGISFGARNLGFSVRCIKN